MTGGRIFRGSVPSAHPSRLAHNAGPGTCLSTSSRQYGWETISASGKILVAADVIAVMMRGDQVTERLVGHLADGGDHRFRVHRRRQRIEHQHAFVADDHAGVADLHVVLPGPPPWM